MTRDQIFKKLEDLLIGKIIRIRNGNTKLVLSVCPVDDRFAYTIRLNLSDNHRTHIVRLEQLHRAYKDKIKFLDVFIEHGYLYVLILYNNNKQKIALSEDLVIVDE